MPAPFSGQHSLHSFHTDGYAVKHLNQLLGKLLGRGSFSRVFQMAELGNLCVKVATGGLSDTSMYDGSTERSPNQKELNQMLDGLEQQHIPAVGYYHYSSGRASKLLSHEQISFLIACEFRMLCRIYAFKTPSDPAPLYPQPFGIGMVNTTVFYVMETIHGCTLRTVFSKLWPARDKALLGADVVRIDFLELFARLLGQMDELMRRKVFWHGDMKPENIMLTRDTYALAGLSYFAW
jgi:serine/threonine protein kinase